MNDKLKVFFTPFTKIAKRLNKIHLCMLFFEITRVWMLLVAKIVETKIKKNDIEILISNKKIIVLEFRRT